MKPMKIEPDCRHARYIEQQRHMDVSEVKERERVLTNINSLFPPGSGSASVHLPASPLCKEGGQQESWMCVVH